MQTRQRLDTTSEPVMRVLLRPRIDKLVSDVFQQQIIGFRADGLQCLSHLREMFPIEVALHGRFSYFQQ
jgi:hypothetical protein